MGDQEEPIELNPALGRTVLEALECPVCLETMTPPIMMCSSGHNMCRLCRPRLQNCPTCRQPLLHTRNVALEGLARQLLPEGLQQARLSLPESEQQAQPSAPPAELIDEGCPLECPWTGLRAELRDHLWLQHKEKVLVGTRTDSCNWDLALTVRDSRVLLAFGEVFLYRERLHTLKKIFYITVKYVGRREEAARFRYEVELTTGGGQRVMVVGQRTLDGAQVLEQVYEQGVCITLDYDLVSKMTLDKQFVYTLKLSKVAS